MADFPLYGGVERGSTTTDQATSQGCNLTTSASANTKGAWAQLISSTLEETAWIAIQASANAVAGRFAFDIGVGASTAEKVLIPDLYAEQVVSGQPVTRSYLFPVRVKAGTRLSARCQSVSGGSQVMTVGVQVISPTLGWPAAGGVVEACGVTTAGGTRLTAVDPGGTINTLGSWTQIIASTTYPYRWVCIAFGHGSSTTGVSADMLVDIGIGANPNEKVLIPGLFVRNGSGVDTPPTTFCLPISIPVGTRISARMQSSNNTATDRIHDIALWGVS